MQKKWFKLMLITASFLPISLAAECSSQPEKTDEEIEIDKDNPLLVESQKFIDDLLTDIETSYQTSYKDQLPSDVLFQKNYLKEDFLGIKIFDQQKLFDNEVSLEVEINDLNDQKGEVEATIHLQKWLARASKKIKITDFLNNGSYLMSIGKEVINTFTQKIHLLPSQIKKENVTQEDLGIKIFSDAFLELKKINLEITNIAQDDVAGTIEAKVILKKENDSYAKNITISNFLTLSSRDKYLINQYTANFPSTINTNKNNILPSEILQLGNLNEDILGIKFAEHNFDVVFALGKANDQKGEISFVVQFKTDYAISSFLSLVIKGYKTKN